MAGVRADLETLTRLWYPDAWGAMLDVLYRHMTRNRPEKSKDPLTLARARELRRARRAREDAEIRERRRST